MRVDLIDADTIVWIAAYLNKDKTDEEMFLGIDNFLSELFVNTKADMYVGFLQQPGSHDVRRTMFPDYKGNRPPTPDWLKDRRPKILDYLVNTWKFVYTEKGYEADDAVASVQHSLINKPLLFPSSPVPIPAVTPIVCSPDKDLKQIPGWNYNTKTKVLSEISKEEAVRHVCMQLLHGDSTDNIPNVMKGFGPAAAAKLVDNVILQSEHRVHATLQKFIEEHGEFNGLTRFAENVLKVVMRRDPDYPFVLVDVPEYIKSQYK